MIFMVLPLLFVPLVYGISSTPDACALPPEPGWESSETCAAPTRNPETGTVKQTCCWKDKIGGKLPPSNEAMYCQTCMRPEGSVKPSEMSCDPPVRQLPAPTGGVSPTPEPGVLQVPTPAPASPLGPRPFTPLDEGTIQEPQTSPTPTPEDNQGDDDSRPSRGQTGPLGGGVLQEPEDDGQEEEPEDDGQEGADTAGPLT